MSSLALVLKNAPETQTPIVAAPETDEVAVEISAAPQTSDNTAVMAIVVFLTVAAGLYGEKRKAMR